MRQTGDSLIAAYDLNRLLCLNNMHVLVPINNPKMDILYFLGIINSKLLNWYYHSINPELGEALAEVKKTNVAKLPIFVIEFSNPSNKTRHDKMVDHVTKMLDLNKRLASARTPQEQSVLKTQIETTDKLIDRLVYELYDLTPEEIEIVSRETVKV